MSYMIMSKEFLEDVMFLDYKGSRVRITDVKMIEYDGEQHVYMEVSGDDLPDEKLRIRKTREAVESTHKFVTETEILTYPPVA